MNGRPTIGVFCRKWSCKRRWQHLSSDCWRRTKWLDGRARHLDGWMSFVAQQPVEDGS